MLSKIRKIVGLVLGGALGQIFITLLGLSEEIKWEFAKLITNNTVYGVVGGAVLGFLLVPWIIIKIFNIINQFKSDLEKIPGQDILSGIMGLVIGLLLGVLISISFSISSIPRFGLSIQVLINFILGYLGWTLGVNKREEFLTGINCFNNKNNNDNKENNYSSEVKGQLPQNNNDDVEELQSTYKILDTSAIIDGRVADICKTSFIEGVLVIPEFVLEELQHIADSSNILKRNRGRRGLDILNKIQNEIDIPVLISSKDYDDIKEVDRKLVKLAQELNGQVVTNDYNLNKVSELQGVSVLNINELANAVKPVVLPGEEMEVKIIKDGEEPGQGVGYLNDGTMIVVDDGKDHIGEDLDVLVTSVLQTSAGRMIFAKPKYKAKKVL
ncbi:MAG: PIN/TRAM domain-containing protein [Bacillota bacterium]